MSKEIDFVLRNIFLVKLKLSEKLAKFCLVNAGLILHGPPGSGKSFLARAISRVWQQVDSQISVRFVRGPELFNQYVGKTEENVRGLFDEALENLQLYDEKKVELRQHLIIIDEIDSMFGVRGSDASSQAVDRATAMFISMLDDLDLRQNLFIIGTTNRFDLIDPAIARKGRLGHHL